MSGVYYNEIDFYAAAWLRNLITGGLLPGGDVDERSIVDVHPGDLAGYTQCHFFAGIGGWPYALRLAGWPDDRPVWTGSCPCQPFSAAGKRRGTADERHLWPEFRRLIAECRPPSVFGEQVASADGRLWLSGVRADLEAMGYGVGAADLCAAGVGAPHIRQRLWWVGHAEGEREGSVGGVQEGARAERGGGSSRLADADGGIAGDGGLQPGRQHGHQPQNGGTGRMGDTDSAVSELASRFGARPGEAEGWRACGQPDGSSSFGSWPPAAWLLCTDGKARRAEPSLQPLAHGVPGRVGRLRAYGNAIVPAAAAEFIKAFLEC